ncbi:hypothetical protein GGE07_005936 [Sinorhizobium terangae]|nr:hypothetical protein [Sinorhizobium terangae]
MSSMVCSITTRTPLRACITIHLGRTRTTTSDDSEHVLLIGQRTALSDG